MKIKNLISSVMVCMLCVSLCACNVGEAKIDEAETKFNQVKDEVTQMAGQISFGDNYFSVDTYPYDETSMNPTVIAMLKDETQAKTMEAISWANIELGFPSYVFSDMKKTSASMGRQNAENDDYKVTWTYHPDEGLEVTYELKK